MAFTYDLTTAVGQVRLALGDKTANDGVNPDGSNLSDEEIALLLAQQGNDVMRAVAAACETLATTWARYSQSTIAQRNDAYEQSQQYADRARDLRQRQGGGSTTFSSAFKRNDGFENSVAA
jgi:hypothetical protein